MSRDQGDETAVDAARRAILALISTGELEPGRRLGSERELSARLGVSRATLRQALGALADLGAVRRVPGRGGGTFVSKPKVERDLSSVVGVPALLREQGFTAGSRVVGAGMVAADEPTAAALAVEPGDLVTEIVRIRLADGEPLSLENARFPSLRFPNLLEFPLGGSIYDLLAERYGVRPVEAIESIEAVPAGPHEAAVLDVALGIPLLAIARTTFDASGRPFEFSHDLFRADRTRILVRTQGAAGTADSARARGRLIDLNHMPRRASGGVPVPPVMPGVSDMSG
ncbi:GntR family transcriptional regulator [Sphaerisporangium album]|uniref:GntR family transcriptional regulator n=1 Tax=Sphaerisporangium album TaxID=509200 RepID=A0A367ER22_9ACTN|nr:GntR family transcriptional regulator [Sphaerisporangium album]RCG20179.1 GntR family transcriptional regulator [Sphaerisporangium album]